MIPEREELKRKAREIYESEPKSLITIAKELNIPHSTVRRWKYEDSEKDDPWLETYQVRNRRQTRRAERLAEEWLKRQKLKDKIENGLNQNKISEIIQDQARLTELQDKKRELLSNRPLSNLEENKLNGYNNSIMRYIDVLSKYKDLYPLEYEEAQRKIKEITFTQNRTDKIIEIMKSTAKAEYTRKSLTMAGGNPEELKELDKEIFESRKQLNRFRLEYPEEYDEAQDKYNF